MQLDKKPTPRETYITQSSDRDSEPVPQEIPIIGNVKGTGDILFGKGDFAADGSFIVIRWFGLAYIPLIPLSGYFVTNVRPDEGNVINQYEGINVVIPKSQLWFIALHFLLLLSFVCCVFFLPHHILLPVTIAYACAYGVLILIKRASEKVALDHARKHNIQRDIKKLIP